jgi:hypothetical protein
MPTAVEFKYVMINHIEPILFVSQHHNDMEVHGHITSAAFFKIHHAIEKLPAYVETYGRSVSLNLGPEPDDAHIIAHFLGLY